MLHDVQPQRKVFTLNVSTKCCFSGCVNMSSFIVFVINLKTILLQNKAKENNAFKSFWKTFKTWKLKCFHVWIKDLAFFNFWVSPLIEKVKSNQTAPHRCFYFLKDAQLDSRPDLKFKDFSQDEGLDCTFFFSFKSIFVYICVFASLRTVK